MASTLFNFTVTQEQKALISEVAASKGVSAGSFVRDAVKGAIAAAGREWPVSRREMAVITKARRKTEKAKLRSDKLSRSSIFDAPTMLQEGLWDARPKPKSNREGSTSKKS